MISVEGDVVDNEGTGSQHRIGAVSRGGAVEHMAAVSLNGAMESGCAALAI